MNNLLINNSVLNAGGSGIELYGSRDNELIGNNFTDSGSGYGIRLQFTNGTTMIDNTLENGTFLLLLGLALDPSLYYQGEIHGNLVNGKPLVYWQNVNGGTVPTNAGQVFIVNCTDIEIANLNLQDVPNSIVVAASSRLNIHDNTIYNCMLALEIDTLTDSLISSNVINDISGSGINIKTGNNLIISDNLIYNCGGGSTTGGIYLKNVDDSVIVDNTIQDVSTYGISLDTSLNNTIYQNNFSVYSLAIPLSYGMNMYFADDNWVVNNSFYNFTNNGIYFYYSDNNSILTNTIRNTTGYGIYVRSSNEVTFKFNALIDNNEGSVQAYDDGTTNVFKYNYWNDMTGPDSPPDGFVDTNYTIDGGPKNNDTFALTVPYSVTPPAFISPIGDEALKENVSVQWTAASDTLGNAFTYDLFYTGNGGMDWVSLATDLDTTAFEWETLELPNSTLYMLKVIARNSEGFFAEDISNAVFAVQNIAHRLLSPIITSPIGGDTIDGYVSIQWSAATDSWNHSYSVSYDLYYSADGGTSWTLLDAFSSTGYVWNTSDFSDGSNYKLKVEASNTEGLTSDFITNPAITIQNHVLSIPTVITPNGGEALALGETVEIQWTASTDTLGHTVTYTVYYSDNGGASWIELASDLTETTTPWTTTVSDGINYMIKVVSICSEGLTAEDTSDAAFTVQNIIPTSSTATAITTPTTTPTTAALTTTHPMAPTTTAPTESTSEIVNPTSTETSTPPAGSSPGWTGSIMLLAIGVLILLRRKQ